MRDECTWCGHPVHAGECDRVIEVTGVVVSGVFGSVRRKAIKRVPCPCKKRG